MEVITILRHHKRQYDGLAKSKQIVSDNSNSNAVELKTHSQKVIRQNHASSMSLRDVYAFVCLSPTTQRLWLVPSANSDTVLCCTLERPLLGVLGTSSHSFSSEVA